MALSLSALARARALAPRVGVWVGWALGGPVGWFWTGAGHSPDTEDPFPPAQSCGVWEVHRT
ncbi:hypothetical protein M9458_018944, partial [Cirrhinus mrigala]